VTRQAYAPEIRIIRLMCTGRVDLAFVLRAFQKGADGVIIGGCWLGECHYVTEGNYHALNMMHLARRLLEHTGVNPARLRIEWISAAEGVRFAEIMNDFAATLRKLGPVADDGELDDVELRSRLEEVSRLIPYIKVEMREKLTRRLEKPEDYDDLYTRDEVEKLFTETVSYHIDPEKCQACMICLRKCPVHGIDGAKSLIHVIDQDTCIKCGTCYDACPERFGAVSRLSGVPVPPPIPEDQRTIDRKGRKAG
jgi:coenzyme F420-reducing hydrogenase delta subunit/NAD-dependent dihydropyrimidine dehydrogenase PreA subunit